MSLPNADRAIIDPAKVRDYLLSGSHPVGRFKATLFFALGYTADRWEILRDDLLTLARTCVATPGQSSLFGLKFELDGILYGPSGRSAAVKTVWIVRLQEELPRFITAFPR